MFFSRLAAALRMELTVAELADRSAGATTTPELATALRSCARLARRHVANIEAAFRLAGKEPWERPCSGVDGLIREEEVALRRSHPSLRAATILASSRAILAHGAATYDTLLDLATAIGAHDAIGLLRENRDEQLDAIAGMTEVSGALAARRAYA